MPPTSRPAPQPTPLPQRLLPGLALLLACSSGPPPDHSRGSATASNATADTTPNATPDAAPNATPDAAPVATPVATIDATVDGLVLLDIPARAQAPKNPPSGWCGETAIQEALIYFGAFMTQRDINRAGKPRFPDLYWSDIPTALRGVGLAYQRWSGRGGYDDFIAWIERHIRAGHPVFTGVKLYPTGHPRWGLDHMVLVVGYEPGAALHINTTWGRRERRTHDDLRSDADGISLKNRYGRYYAYAIKGLAPGRAAQAAPQR